MLSKFNKIVLLTTVCLLLLSGCNKKEDKIVYIYKEGDLEMEYIKFGNGEKSFVIIPGLSIHSVMNSADAIKEAYKDFSDDYTVYVFDRPKNIRDGYTIENLSDDTAKVMKGLGIKNAYIFGASQGGMIAQCLTINYPDLVSKLVLGSTLSKPNDNFLKVAGNWISLAKEKNEDELLKSFVEDVYSKNTLDAYEDTLISSNKGISDEEYERFIILANSCLTFNVYDDLTKIKCPVLVLGCDGDKAVTPLGSKEIADKLNCEIYMYDESYGHGVYDEASDYKTRLLDFFNE